MSLLTLLATFGSGSLQTVRGIMIFGQSNASGLAPISDLTSEYLDPFPKVFIWNNDTMEAEVLQAGVNEAGLDGDILEDLGTPGYEDGFGAEIGFAKKWNDLQSENIYLLKKNVQNVSTTDSANIATLTTLFNTEFLDEYNNLKDYLAGQGKTLVIDTLVWNQGEADTGNANFKSDTVTLLNHIQTNCLTSDAIKLIVRTKAAAYSDITTKQAEMVSENSDMRLIDVTGMTFLPDNVHTDAASMIEEGELVYDAYLAR